MTDTGPKSVLDWLAQPPPAILYHYTSTDVLAKIVQSGSVWASDVRYLNDAFEYRYLFDVIQSRLAERIENEQQDQLRHLSETFVATQSAMQRQSFVACFSTKGDELSQWRGYTPPGQGVCIGFSSAAIRKKITLPVPLSEDGQQRLISEGISLLAPVAYLASNGAEFDSLIDKSCSFDPALPVISSQQLVTVILSGIAPFYKHASFQSESEWRLLLGTNVHTNKVPRVSFRQGKSMLIPYSEVDLRTADARYIEEVIVGPTPNLDLSIQSLRYLLDTYGLTSAKVIASSVPYRSW